jgi:hypothetical protein
MYHRYIKVSELAKRRCSLLNHCLRDAPVHSGALPRPKAVQGSREGAERSGRLGGYPANWSARSPRPLAPAETGGNHRSLEALCVPKTSSALIS